MIDKLSEAFSFRQEALNLRRERQEILAANIANADTPFYKARDIDFRSELARALGPTGDKHSGLALTVTSTRHLAAETGGTRHMQNLLYRVPDQPSLDGNTVDMERERAQYADNSVQYQASLTLMNNLIQGLRKSMQSE